MNRVVVGIMVVVLALGLVGCTSISEKIGEKVGEEIAGDVVGGDVDVDDESVTIETDDGAVTIEGDAGEIPEDFPSDVPLYKGYELDTASRVASTDETDYYVNLTSEDEVGDIYDWYKAELTDAGWTITGDINYSDADTSTAMLVATKDTMEVTVSIASADSGSEIGIMLMVK